MGSTRIHSQLNSGSAHVAEGLLIIIPFSGLSSFAFTCPAGRFLAELYRSRLFLEWFAEVEAADEVVGVAELAAMAASMSDDRPGSLLRLSGRSLRAAIERQSDLSEKLEGHLQACVDNALKQSVVSIPGHLQELESWQLSAQCAAHSQRLLASAQCMCGVLGRWRRASSSTPGHAPHSCVVS